MKYIKMEKENRRWDIICEENPAISHIYWGMINGKLSTKHIKYDKGKNIGKSNETTPFEQAWLEAISMANKKADNNYKVIDCSDKSLINKINKDKIIRPMLATKYNKKRKINEFCYCQPKIDGSRCLFDIKNNKTMTRQGKEITTINHIKNALKINNIKNKNLILDGEIYVHGWDFQRIISAIKKESEDTKLLKYHIYDIIDLDNLDLTFNERYLQYTKIEFNDIIKQVDSILVDTDYIDDYYENYIKQGYEGMIIRANDCKYRLDKRSNDLMKYKPIDDDEFIIIGYETEIMQNNKEGIIYRCKTKDNKEFNVRPKGNINERMKWLNTVKEDIGKSYTVQYQGLTNDGIPRFPVGKSIREDH